MDAYIKFQNDKGREYIIAIETKYTDVLGVNEARNCKDQKQMLIDTGLFDTEFEKLLTEGKVKLTQIYRNLLLTERYRLVEELQDSYSVVISPKEHPSTEEEIESVTKFLKPEYSYKLSAVTLEDFVNTMIHTLPSSYASVYEKFRKRYLDFEKLS